MPTHTGMMRRIGGGCLVRRRGGVVIILNTDHLIIKSGRKRGSGRAADEKNYPENRAY